jgi:hypothetical protein
MSQRAALVTKLQTLMGDGDAVQYAEIYGQWGNQAAVFACALGPLGLWEPQTKFGRPANRTCECNTRVVTGVFVPAVSFTAFGDITRVACAHPMAIPPVKQRQHTATRQQ